MKVYISGPMTGVYGLNKAAFREAVRELYARGHEPISPVWARVEEPSWHAYMHADLSMLDRAEAIMFLPGWQGSVGACVERRYAKKHGVQILG
jgi:hypothetical protein